MHIVANFSKCNSNSHFLGRAAVEDTWPPNRNQLAQSHITTASTNHPMHLTRQHSCRQLLACLWVGGLLLSACTAQKSPTSQRQSSLDAGSVQTFTTKAAASPRSRRIGQPLWLQERVKTHPNSSGDTRQADTQAPTAAHQTISTDPYILLQRDQALALDTQNRVKHVLKLSSAAGAGSRTAVPAIRVVSRGLRGGVVHRASLKSQGEAANITIRIPDGNEYLGIGVFAEDLDAGANVDIALVFGEEIITESNNPVGVDDFLEAPEGLMPGEYRLIVKGSNIPSSLTALVYIWVQNSARGRAETATALPLKVTPNPVLLTAAAGCCTAELLVAGLEFANTPTSRYIGILRYVNTDGNPMAGAAPTTVYML